MLNQSSSLRQSLPAILVAVLLSLASGVATGQVGSSVDRAIVLMQSRYMALQGSYYTVQWPMCSNGFQPQGAVPIGQLDACSQESIVGALNSLHSQILSSQNNTSNTRFLATEQGVAAGLGNGSGAISRAEFTPIQNNATLEVALAHIFLEHDRAQLVVLPSSANTTAYYTATTVGTASYPQNTSCRDIANESGLGNGNLIPSITSLTCGSFVPQSFAGTLSFDPIFNQGNPGIFTGGSTGSAIWPNIDIVGNPAITSASVYIRITLSENAGDWHPNIGLEVATTTNSPFVLYSTRSLSTGTTQVQVRGTKNIPTNVNDAFNLPASGTCNASSVNKCYRGSVVVIGHVSNGLPTESAPQGGDFRPFLPPNIRVGTPSAGNYTANPCDQLVAPQSGNPVDLASGYKQEQSVDLIVPTPGASWNLQRGYTSQLNYLTASTGGSICGAGWSMNVFRALRVPGGAQPNALRLEGWPLGSSLEFTWDQSQSKWIATGGPTQYIESTSICIDGSSRNVWKLVEPGAWEHYFAREVSTNEYQGEVLLEADAYGNGRYFNYVAGNNGTKRLGQIAFVDRVALAGTTCPKPSASTVLFFDYDTSSAGTSDTSGMLRSTRLVRIATDGTPITTHKTSYLYGQDDNPEAVNTRKNLLQVTYSTLVDSPTPTGPATFREQIVQYRYHNSANYLGDDPRLTANGSETKLLRLVINPAQVEYFAQVMQSPGADFSLVRGANQLRALSDVSQEVLDLASKIIGYGPDGKVVKQFVQSGCNCAGGGQGILEEYSYLTATNFKSTVIDERITPSGGTQFSQLYRRRITDMELVNGVPYTVFSVMQAEQSGNGASWGRTWVTEYVYDNAGKLVFEFTPSAIQSYSPLSPTSAPSVVRKSGASAGKAFKYEYTNNRRTKTFERQPEGDGFVPTSETVFGSTPVDSHLPLETRRFRTESLPPTNPDPDTVETTVFSYGFYPSVSSTLSAISFIGVEAERELASENGPSGASTLKSMKAFNSLGQQTWSMDSERVLTYQAYDEVTGAVTVTVTGAPEAGYTSTSSAPQVPPLRLILYPGATGFASGIARSSGGLATQEGGLTYTTSVVDSLGRVRSSSVPGGWQNQNSPLDSGIVSYASWSMEQLPTEHLDAGNRPKLNYYAETIYPPISKANPISYAGPAVRTWYAADGAILARSEFTRESGNLYNVDTATGSVRLTQAQGGDPVLERSRFFSDRNKTGQVTQERRWSVLQPTSLRITGMPVSVDTTSFAYDNLGRLASVTTPNGSITRYTHDATDRVVKLESGVVSASLPFVTTQELFYDSIGATQGVGNGNLTLDRKYPDASGTRDTEMRYDNRDRLRVVINPIPPHSVTTYDNLNRVVSQSLHEGFPTDQANCVQFSDTQYSQRGLVYRRRVAVVPTQSISDNNSLKSNFWFDSRGLVIAEQQPSSPGVKREFDTLGRVVREFITAGVSGNYLSATSITGDIVAEQNNFTYAKHTDPWTGALLLSTNFKRVHDLAPSQTGALDNAPGCTTCSSVATYAGTFYDLANRAIRSINYGTNAQSSSPTHLQFAAAGPAPNLPLDPYSSDFNPNPNNSLRIVVSTAYDSMGRVEFVTDGNGNSSATWYDDLGRTTATIDNAKSPNDVQLVWDGNLQRARLTSIQNPNENQVTSFVYDASGHLKKRVVHIAKSDGPSSTGDAQVTAYMRGYNDTSINIEQSNLLPSSDVLLALRYPNRTTGEPGPEVTYGYNRLGEIVGQKDLNGTRRLFTRDTRGRVTDDSVTFLGSGVDGTVMAIARTFDNTGRLSTVRSLSSTSAVLNEVEYRYTSLWQTEALFQDNDGLVQRNGFVPSGNTRVTKYGYANSSSLNNALRTSVIYPTERVDQVSQTFFYDTFQRMFHSKDYQEDELLDYTYLGLNTIATASLGNKQATLDRTLSVREVNAAIPAGARRGLTPEVSGTQGVYPGFDRYGRVASHAWVQQGHGLFAGTPSNASISNLPAYFHEIYKYDNASRQLSRYDVRSGKPTVLANFVSDEGKFEYDGLDRLKEQVRETKPSSTPSDNNPPPIAAIGSKRWTLDIAENVKVLEIKTQTPATYDFIRNFTHNRVNEVSTDAVGSASTTYQYDDSGNQRWDGRRYAVYDAWGRLVRIEYRTNPGTPNPNVFSEFKYNGLHQRIYSKDKEFTQERTRSMYYSDQWQLIEEHIGRKDGSDESYHYAQQFYGARGLDDAVLRVVRVPEETQETLPNSWEEISVYEHRFFQLSDPKLSTRVVIRGGDYREVVERVDYDAFGVSSHLFGADINQDQQVTTDDTNVVHTKMGASNYDLRQDVNCDSVVDATDEEIISLYEGRTASKFLFSDDTVDGKGLCGPDNVIGYGGYVRHQTSRLWLARHRWYNAETARWLQRDPAGYVDSNSLYAYCGGEPVGHTDPFGLLRDTDFEYRNMPRTQPPPQVDLSEEGNAAVASTLNAWRDYKRRFASGAAYIGNAFVENAMEEVEARLAGHSSSLGSLANDGVVGLWDGFTGNGHAEDAKWTQLANNTASKQWTAQMQAGEDPCVAWRRMQQARAEAKAVSDYLAWVRNLEREVFVTTTNAISLPAGEMAMLGAAGFKVVKNASGGARFIADDVGRVVDTHATPPGRYIQPDGSATDILQAARHPGLDPFTSRTHTHRANWNLNPNEPSRASFKLADDPNPVTPQEIKNIMDGSAKRGRPKGR